MGSLNEYPRGARPLTIDVGRPVATRTFTEVAAGSQDSNSGLASTSGKATPMLANQPRLEGGNIVVEIDEREYNKGILDNQ